MSSIKQAIISNGTISGRGLEASCVASALKVTLPGLNISAYARYQIHRVSQELPEGDYSLSVNGQTFAIRLRNGQWLSASPF